jgi:3-hydroxyisobutyrate dehydrogenase-like beta-hydroxyacid dehydrogenase
MQIGLIGLGNMGAGLARNLMKGGHDLIVWNRSPGPVEALVAEGATRAENPGDAFQAEVTLSMLSQDEAIEEVVVASGALDAAKAGAIHVNLSTVSVAFADRMEALHGDHGLAYVAAPVLGRPDAAAAGKLNVLCAGAPEAVAKARPLLELFAAKVWDFGDKPSRANVAKLAVNFSLASMIETLGEAGSLAEAYGIKRAELYELMTNTLFAAPAYKTYAALIADGSFEPAGFKMTLGLKDVRLALAAGEAAKTPLPIASALRDGFIEAIAAGDGEKDWSGLAGQAFRRAGRPLG